MRQAFELIKKSSNIALVSHINPDADTLGSSLAMFHSLSFLGKKITVYNCSEIPASLSFLPGIELVTNIFPSECDLVISLDCGDIKRLGLKDGNYKILNIDHHASNPLYGDENIVIADAASTASVVLKFLRELDIVPDKKASICLYAALASDTGFFQYDETDENVFLDAAYLAKCGASAPFAAKQMKQREPLSKIKLLSAILQTLELRANGKMAFLYMTQEMMQKCGAKSDEADGAVETARSIDGVEMSLFLREEKDGKIRASLRSKDYADVNAMALIFGGGGHVRAAGFTVAFGDDFVTEAYKMVKTIEDEFVRKFV